MNPKAEVKATNIKGEQPNAAISEVHAVADDGLLKSLIFFGIRTNQIEINDGRASLRKDPSPIFVSRLAAAARESIVLSPGITPQAIDESRVFKDKGGLTVTHYLKELKAVTRAIEEKYAQVGGFLGSPVTGVEFGGKDYQIAFQKFAHGAIYVTPSGTYDVRGAIYQKYVGLGAETGFLGFPETGELATVLRIISRDFGPTLESGWDLMAVADFDLDGVDDYLLFKDRPVPGATKIWYIVRRNRDREASGPTVGPGWRLRGAADFNRDGHPDYLLYHARTRQTAIWYLNNNRY